MKKYNNFEKIFLFFKLLVCRRLNYLHYILYLLVYNHYEWLDVICTTASTKEELDLIFKDVDATFECWIWIAFWKLLNSGPNINFFLVSNVLNKIEIIGHYAQDWCFHWTPYLKCNFLQIELLLRHRSLTGKSEWGEQRSSARMNTKVFPVDPWQSSC